MNNRDEFKEWIKEQVMEEAKTYFYDPADDYSAGCYLQTRFIAETYGVSETELSVIVELAEEEVKDEIARRGLEK